MEIKLQPWTTPDFVIGVAPPRPRQEGFHFDAIPKWKLEDVDSDTLARMCDAWRMEIFRKAKKPDPASRGAEDYE